MLKRLTIENYALIRQLDISFEAGFSTLTGETGAGKSIMLGALGLVLGNRADTQVLWDKEKKCIVEAVFYIASYQLEPLFVSHDLDHQEEAIFRRDINPAGKSRAFINDTLVNLQVLRDIGSRLINIHSQHEILVLNNRDFQLAMLDSFAGIEEDVNAYQFQYKTFKRLSAELEELKNAYARQLAQHDYDAFLFEELTAANLDVADMTELEEECRLLENAGEIRGTLYRIEQLLEGEPLEFLATLKNLTDSLQKLGNTGSIGALVQRLATLYLEAEDLRRDIFHTNEQVLDDPEKLSAQRERLSHLYHLFQKHRVNGIEELIRLRNDLDNRLLQQTNTGDAIRRTEQQCSILLEEIRQQAAALRDKRRKALQPLTAHLENLLNKLGMPDAVIRITLDLLMEPGSDGTDTVTFRFSANMGSEPDLISRIASGGELSRLMLAVKSVLSTKKLIPTIIFDEIDAGVSGEIAGKTGNIMKEMGKTMQVIAITHLPQIAAKGIFQYLATKSQENGRTVSSVKLLSGEEREYEIARMLSDDEPTKESLANARQLLHQNRPAKN